MNKINVFERNRKNAKKKTRSKIVDEFKKHKNRMRFIFDTKIKLSEPSGTQKHENFGCERNGDVNTAAKSKTIVSFFSFFLSHMTL